MEVAVHISHSAPRLFLGNSVEKCRNKYKYSTIDITLVAIYELQEKLRLESPENKFYAADHKVGVKHLHHR